METEKNVPCYRNLAITGTKVIFCLASAAQCLKIVVLLLAVSFFCLLAKMLKLQDLTQKLFH